jgi:hypothetical protein
MHANLIIPRTYNGCQKQTHSGMFPWRIEEPQIEKALVHPKLIFRYEIIR